MRAAARLARALSAGAAALALAALGVPAASAATSPSQSPASPPAPGSTAARSVGGPLMAGTGTVVSEPAGDPPLPSLPASAWVVANATTGQVLAAKDPHGEFAPASTLKMLTAITLIPRLNPDAQVVASKLATSQEPNDAGLVTGRSYKISDLFRAMLLISANDAAVALTEATGSFAGGMALINAEAQRLQAYDVVAKLPNGLPATGQEVSAYDEALIARQALALPAFMAYDQTLRSPFEVKPGDTETLVNQNDLLTKYPGGIGGKIGWTIASQATYIGMARRNGVTLIVTVLHCKALQEITAAEKLLDWGFAMNGKVTPVGTLVAPLSGPGASTRPAGAHPAAAAGTPSPAAAAAASPPPGPAADELSRGAVASAASYAVASGGAFAAVAGIGAVALTRRRRRAARRWTGWD